MLAVIICGGVTFSNFAFAQQSAQSFPKKLDDYVAATVRDWEIPGVAIAVVKDGKVVVVRGYGVRELGKAETIDENTIFDAASLTKSFTVAAIALLVDEKKMSWDDPVKRYIPTIEFPDPYLTANITMRDLLCHRTGVRATNSAWRRCRGGWRTRRECGSTRCLPRRRLRREARSARGGTEAARAP